jgi:hypothetical protein
MMQHTALPDSVRFAIWRRCATTGRSGEVPVAHPYAPCSTLCSVNAGETAGAKLPAQPKGMKISIAVMAES